MIIRNRKELKFCIKADNMINIGRFDLTLKDRIISFINPTFSILRFLKIMRKCQYYECQKNRGGINGLFYRSYYAIFGRKLGFSIGYQVFGYALTINHYGTIIVGGDNRIGNFALIDTSTNIGSASSVIGHNFYVGPGVKIIKHVIIGNNVRVGANSVIRDSFPEGNLIVAGIPANRKKYSIPWYEIEGEEYIRRVVAINKLKEDMGVILD